ncbi:MAG: type I-U CRISPR-associated protein Csx17 [Gemmatimonadaceae bacterium]|nr:type I-U CRISPR-associated protein Csx17 [Gemmatimonadaceae bacterium]
MTSTIVLTGVHPTPLAGYLKAIALLRIVAEQLDADVTGWWTADGFAICAAADEAELADFLLTRWSPTPVVAPWNGGSGFREKDQQAGIATIEHSSDPRFTRYRSAIATSRRVLASHGLADKPELLARLRAELADDAIRWLDAAVVLGAADTPKYPPLLGTGGNDGRLEFSNNQMQRLVTLLLTPKEARVSRSQLAHALYGSSAVGSQDPIGQFAPGRAGGVNTGFGFSREAIVNPWDYVLALEGALLFAASASRSHESASDVAFPFYVRGTMAGFGSASSAEEDRGELWMPLWQHPATSNEIALLIGEGRAWLSTRPARTGEEFSRAIRRLGVSRGIAAFQRFVIAQRNGLSFFATPAGQYRVADTPETDPLAGIDAQLERVRSATLKPGCPASVVHAYRTLSDAILDRRAGGGEAHLLLALGDLSAAVARSRRAQALEHVLPIPPTPEGSWPSLAASDDPVWEIARALASGRARAEVDPVDPGARYIWRDLVRESEMGPAVGFVDRLLRVGQRRLHRDPPLYAFTTTSASVRLSTIVAFVDGQLKGGERWLGRAFQSALLTSEPAPRIPEPNVVLPVPIATCIAALFVATGESDAGQTRRLPTRMLELLASGDGDRALQAARQYLISANFRPRFPHVSIESDGARRLAVALLFPLSRSLRALALRSVCHPSSDTPQENPTNDDLVSDQLATADLR